MTKEEIAKLFLGWDNNLQTVYTIDTQRLKIEMRQFLGYKSRYHNDGIKKDEVIILKLITDAGISKEFIQPDSVYATYEQAKEVLNRIINDKIKSLEALKL